MMEKTVLLAALLLATAGAASVQVSDPAKCTLCQAVVTELKVVMEDKDTKDFLAVLQTFICDNVPIEDCNNWVSGELAQLDSLVEGLDPNQACSSLALCAVPSYPLQSSIQCDFCEFLGDEVVKRVLTNATIDEVVAAAETICSELPFGSNECSALVKEYGHYYLELLVGSIDVAQLCSKVGLCSQEVREMVLNSELFQIIQRGLKDDEGCKACVDGMDVIKEILSSKDTLDLLHIAVHEICGLVSVSGCELIADTALDQIIEKLLPMFVPQTICQEIGACPAQEVFSPATVGDDSPLCTGCHDLLGEVKKVANDPETKQINKDLAPVLCEVLSIPFCESLISKFLEGALEKAQNLDVDGTCVSLKACEAEEDERVESWEDTCSECAMIADLILKELQDPSVQQEIESVLDELCTVLPISDCKETLHTYLVMIETLIASMDGKTLCGYIGLCSSKMSLVKKAAGVTEINRVEFVPNNVGDTCSECTMIAGEIISLLENGTVDTLIKEAISELCTVLPISDCEATIDGYFDEIVALLKNLDGKTLCSLIGLC